MSVSHGGLKVLAIDTTSDHGSIALVEGDQIVEEAPLHSPEGYSYILFQAVEGLLSRYSAGLNAIDGFAAAAGPGSFTGVRVGLTAVKGLAEATSRPVVAVSNLQAMAWFGSARFRAPVLDARRGDIFGAVYGPNLELMGAEVVAGLGTWLSGLPEADIEILLAGLAVPDSGGRPVVEVPRCLAGAIGRIAVAKLTAGEGKDPAEIDANYVRRSDAELAWRDNR